MRVNRFRAVAAALALCGASFSVAQAQVCNGPGGPPTKTCDFNDTPDFLYDAPDTNTVELQGGTLPANTLFLTNELILLNTTGAGPAVSVIATGWVDMTAPSGALFLTQLFHSNGAVTSTWGENVLLHGTDIRTGIESFADTSSNATNRISFGGTIDLQNSLVTFNGSEPDRQSGFVARTTNGTSIAELLASGSILMQGGNVFGVVADTRSFGGGTGNALADVAGVLNLTSIDVDYGQVANGVLAYAENGDATVLFSGSLTQDNRPTSYASHSDVDLIGIYARVEAGGTGTASITMSGTVETYGDDTYGVTARNAGSGQASVTASSAAQVTTHGDRAQGLNASSNDLANLTSAATVLTEGDDSHALAAYSLFNRATIDATGSAIETRGDDAYGIYLQAPLGGTLTAGGSILTAGQGSYGAFANLPTSTSVSELDVDMRTASISTAGEGAAGIRVDAAAGTIAIQTGDIATTGDGAEGVFTTVGDDLTVDTSGGSITTAGVDSAGISVIDSLFSSNDGNRTIVSGAITTTGAQSNAIEVQGHAGNVSVSTSGAVSSSGASAQAITATTTDNGTGAGAVSVTVGAATIADGEYGIAVRAQSALSNSSVTIATGGNVQGGWESSLGALSPVHGDPSAGVLLAAGSGQLATLTNGGTLGASSDRAVLLGGAGGLQLTNTGLLAGYVIFGDANDTLTNSGTVSLRHFADTDGDGARDAKRVAETAFGAGIDVFTNEASGVLLLSQVTGGTASVAGQYVPAGVNAAFHSIAAAGVEQGRLTQLERFENRGTISLADATPVAGDTLLLTSGTIDAGGNLVPGAANMAFISDGGALWLDTVLNEGGANSRSDLLIVDAVAVGAGGATRIFVNNAGGLGAQTVGNGIKLVDVLGGSSVSALNGFVLGGNVFAGPFSYQLFRSGPLGDDGDWYLRTDLDTTPVNPNPPGTPTVPNPPTPPGTPAPPTPPSPPGAPPTTFRPEAPLLASIPNLMRNYDLAAVATYQRRLGEDLNETFEQQRRRGRAWMRVLTTQVDTAQDGVLAPTVDGRLKGLQLGFELPDGGLLPRGLPSLGLYAGRIDGRSDVSGFAMGVNGTAVGSTDLQSTFGGLYGTHRRKSGAYFDFILQRSWYQGDIAAVTGTNVELKGTGILMSFELGKPVRIGRRYALEPQLQLIGQSQSFDPVSIPNAEVDQRASISLTGRVGLRFSGLYHVLGLMQPYVRVNLWKGLPVDDETRYSAGGGTASLETRTDTTSLEGALGLGWSIGRHVFVYAEGGQNFPLNEGDLPQPGQGPSASLGMRVSW